MKNLNVLYIFIVGLCVFCIFGCKHSGINNIYSSASRFGLTPPVEVVEAVVYRDGGTIGVKMKDAIGKELHCCIDGKINSPTQGKFYIFAMHATYEGAKLTKSGDKDQQAIESLLGSWVKRKVTPEIHSEISNVKHGVPLSHEAKKAQTTMAVYKYLKNSIKAEQR